MKSLKIVLGALVMSFSLIAICSFTNKDYEKNAFMVKCYKYSTFFNHRSLDYTDPFFILSPQFSNTNNWNQFFGNPYSVCLGADLMCAVCFDDSQLTPQITFQSILSALWTHFRINGVPYNGETFFLYINGQMIQVTVFTRPD